MKYNETIISRKDWDAIYGYQYINSDGTPNLAKIKTSLYLYHVLLEKVEATYGELTQGQVIDPQTAPEIILSFLEEQEQELIEFAQDEAEVKTRKMLGTFGSN